MTDARRGFFKDNLVLVAAFALPAVVAALFVLATAIPKWTVPLPQHDLVLKVDDYKQPAVIAEFVARNGRLEADLRPVPRPQDPNAGLPYNQRWTLLLFDHRTLTIREVPVDLPASIPDGETRTIVVDALAGRVVTPDTVAPDGYRVTSLSTGGSGGIVGELFGMNRSYRRRIAIGRDGRTIELDLPAPHRDSYGSVVAIGWIR
jgi:hypothetical protein